MKPDDQSASDKVSPMDPNATSRPAWLPSPRTVIFAACALLLAGSLGFYLINAERPVSGTVTGSGMPQVGGPFQLVDQTGRSVTEADFAGKFTLVYFGFTYCPDVCPTALQVMARALDELGDKGEKVQPIFITIDPERDTPENLAAYVRHFSDRLVGLTGTEEQIRAAADAYKVYYKKVRTSGDADYVMEHTDVIYLMGPGGRYVAHFDRTTTPEQMAARIAEALNRGS